MSFPEGFRSAINDIKTQKEEQTKSITASENGEYIITPDEGKVLSSATVNVTAGQKVQNQKTFYTNKSGQYIIEPDAGYDAMSQVKASFFPTTQDKTITLDPYPDFNSFGIQILPDADAYLYSVRVLTSKTHRFITNLISNENISTDINVVIPSNVRSIGPYGLYGAAGVSLVIPESVTVIESYGLYRSGFKYITFQGIPNRLISTALQYLESEELIIPEGWNVSLNLIGSTKLTQESLHSMIENFADMTYAETTPVFTIGSSLISKIDETHIALLESKGWDYS